MWTVNYYENVIDIVPDGEEELHFPEIQCLCRPKIGKAEDGRLMISHKSFDGREFFEQAEANLPEGHKYRKAA